MMLARLQRSLPICALICGALALSPQAQTALEVPELAPAAASAAPQKHHFAVPESGMLVKGGVEGQLSMRDFLREFGSITGETFLIDEESATILEGTRTGLDRDIRVDPENMYSVLQGLLEQNGFVLVDVRRQEPRLLRVVASDSRKGQKLRAWAKFVPEAELEAYAENRAMLVTTCLHLPNLNEYDVANRLRILTVDSNLQLLTAVRGTRQVVLTGPAGQVGEWAALLKELNRNTTVEIAEPVKAAKAAEAEGD